MENVLGHGLGQAMAKAMAIAMAKAMALAMAKAMAMAKARAMARAADRRTGGRTDGWTGGRTGGFFAFLMILTNPKRCGTSVRSFSTHFCTEISVMCQKTKVSVSRKISTLCPCSENH